MPSGEAALYLHRQKEEKEDSDDSPASSFPDFFLASHFLS
jgi:hypothetical protein